MHVKLKVLRGASAGKEVGVRGAKFFIGRSEECHLRANSDAISRRHCAITVTDSEISIQDLNSRNGTFVNGERISRPHSLAMGDQLRVGPLEFLVTYLRPVKAVVTQPKASDDDMAGLIDDWLAEADADASDSTLSSETREFRLDETDRIDVPAKEETETVASKETVTETNQAPSEGQGTQPTRRRNAQPPPKDTQEAAAQTLRKFFNRGG